MLAVSPELDRFCAMIFAYLQFQVVGFCYACLVNASLALACKVTMFLPVEVQEGKGNNPNELSLMYSGDNTIRLISAFYVYYASIRVVVGFGKSVLNLALESIKDFPDASRLLSKDGMFTLRLTPIVFVPSLVLEIGLLTADRVCGVHAGSAPLDEGSFDGAVWNSLCHNTGLYFLTSENAEIRRLVFYALLIMVVQLWQVMLHQFPHWNRVLKIMPGKRMVIFQITILALYIVATITFSMILLGNVEKVVNDDTMFATLFGSTLWLFLFIPYITKEQGEMWAAKTNAESLQGLAAYLRISHLALLAIVFSLVFFNRGLLQAQLDITFLTMVLPTLYCLIFILASVAIRAGPWLFTFGSLTSAISSYVVTRLARNTARGSAILVFFHILGKMIQFFGDDPTIDESWEADSGGILDDVEVSQSNVAKWSTDNLSGLQIDPSTLANDVIKLGDVMASGNASEPMGDSEPENLNEGESNGTLKVCQPLVEDSTSDTCTADHSSDVVTAKSDDKTENDAGSSPPSSLNASEDIADVKNGVESHLNGIEERASESPEPASSESQASEASPRQTARQSRSLVDLSLDLQTESFIKGKSSDALSAMLTTTESIKAVKSEPNLSNTKKKAGLLPPLSILKRDIADSAISRILSDELVQSCVVETPSSRSAKAQMAQRGQEQSSLVSLGLPKQIVEHWYFKQSRRYLLFIGNFARVIAVPDSFVSGIMRCFIGFMVLVTLILCFLSVASFTQETFKFFPKLITFDTLADGSYQFNHKIVNVTLFPTNTSMSNGPNTAFEHVSFSQRSSEHYGNLTPPYYAACDWNWRSLSLLDLAIMSEIAYFDEHTDGSIQHMVDLLFPHLDLQVVHAGKRKARSAASARSTQTKRKNVSDAEDKDTCSEDDEPEEPYEYENGPMYVELYSKALKTSVLSIRGTDVGRFHDFLEDVKLYAEPVIFTLLSTVFPTIRLWSHDTTSRVIEWLYRFNSFFGLQGESEYYRPLVQRIFELVKDDDDHSDNDSGSVDSDTGTSTGTGDDKGKEKEHIIMTGHSLGCVEIRSYLLFHH